ncbi:MAG: MotA/TolQ/ExbB proton channel family protein [Pseudanabaenaceae cyanobacterium bins.68]|nr:MotA/TolQ/ExbB proton channel family protein [Pseudanabaenaceae cyanobacterium bins.68]
MIASWLEFFRSGGIVMVPLLLLSIFSLAAILERSVFWLNLLRQESEVLEQILAAATEDLDIALELAQAQPQVPIARFLAAPLKLGKPNPEIFCLALETAADQELVAMLKQEKLFEAVIAIAPLLGLLGTVTGLILSFSSFRVGDVTANLNSNGLTSGLAEALISTATGLVIAIATLTFQRFFLALHARQVEIFRRAGNQLELTYRLKWQPKP